jgi:hypothetical protein
MGEIATVYGRIRYTTFLKHFFAILFYGVAIRKFSDLWLRITAALRQQDKVSERRSLDV